MVAYILMYLHLSTYMVWYNVRHEPTTTFIYITTVPYMAGVRVGPELVPAAGGAAARKGPVRDGGGWRPRESVQPVGQHTAPLQVCSLCEIFTSC